MHDIATKETINLATLSSNSKSNSKSTNIVTMDSDLREPTAISTNEKRIKIIMPAYDWGGGSCAVGSRVKAR
ncbi:MAG: hypothetical protein SGJ02_05140 [bacterium]|nr:hypothetical protein [bacterium]